MPPQVGQKARRSLTLTEEHVQTFAKLTGDYNPLEGEAWCYTLRPVAGVSTGTTGAASTARS